MKLSKEVMLEKLDDPIEDNIVGHSRWSVQHDVIFEHEGKYYRSWYQVGATESQDESPWEYENEVLCEEVCQVEKTIKVWEAIGEKENSNQI